MKLWVDADACPRDVRQIVVKASRRLEIPVIFVANHDLALPNSPLIEMRLVPIRADEADRTIAEEVEPLDIVITADVPLAAAVVERGADAINPRGEHYTEDDVRNRLSIRDFMEEMRSAGLVQGGPREYRDTDKQRFAATLDRLLTKRVRKKGK